MTTEKIRQRFNLPEKFAQIVEDFLSKNEVTDPVFLVENLLKTGARYFNLWDLFPLKEKSINVWRKSIPLPKELSNQEVALMAELWQRLFFFFQKRHLNAKVNVFNSVFDFVDPETLNCTEPVYFTNPDITGSVCVEWSLAGDTPTLLLSNFVPNRKPLYLPFSPEIWEGFMEEFEDFWESVLERDWSLFILDYNPISTVEEKLQMKDFMRRFEDKFIEKKQKNNIIIQETLRIRRKKIRETWSAYSSSHRGKNMDEAFITAGFRVHEIPPSFSFGDNYFVKAFVSSEAIPMITIAYRESSKHEPINIPFTPRDTNVFYKLCPLITESFNRLQEGYSYIGTSDLVVKKEIN